MNENLPSEENQTPTDGGKINLPETRPSNENSETSDVDETANIKGIPIVQTHGTRHRDLTASHLAKVIVWAFCLSIGFSFLFASAHYTAQFFNRNSEQEQIPDINISLEIFKTVSAVMSGPLGFVLGFYFRESK